MKNLVLITLLLLGISAIAADSTAVTRVASAALTKDTIIYLSTFLGMMLYFFFEYKAKKTATTEFSIGFWVKDNWVNFVSVAGCLALYYFIGDKLPATKQEAAMLGFTGNKIVDYMQDFLTKKA